MSIRPKTVHADLDTEITLYPKQGQLPLERYDVALKVAEDQLLECRLRFALDYEVYRQVEEGDWFNLAGAREPSSFDDFDPQHPVELTISLHPGLLDALQEAAQGSPFAAAAQIMMEGYQAPDAPLVDTESWYCLSITQADGAVKLGYRTRWADGLPQVEESPIEA